MKGGMLPFCVAVALACAFPGSHAGSPSAPEHLVRRDVLAAGESVVGRAVVAGRFLLLTSGRRIVDIAADGAVSYRQLQESDIEFWGLGAARDGSLWSLAGRDMLVEISPGGPRRQLALDGAYAGVHTGPGFLLYQPYDFRVGSPALLRGEPAVPVEPTGLLKVAGGIGRRVAVWMKSLVLCGFVVNDRVPCWPAGVATVDVIGATGAGRLVPLGELAPRLETPVDVFAEHGRPVLQDVALDERDALWVLAADPDGPVLKERGVRDLWRFSLSGTRLGRHRLPAPVRMLMAVGAGRLLAISGDGHLVRLEVK